MCIAARCSVALTISPANRRRRKPVQVGGIGQREQRIQRFGVDRGLGEIEGEVVEAGAELVRAFGVGGEQGGDAPAVRPCGQRGQVGERGLASRWLAHGESIR